MHPRLQRLPDAIVVAFVKAYGAWIFWRHIDGVHAEGLERVRALAAEGPVILALNHSCWWDGILAVKLPHWLGTEGRFFVAEHNEGIAVIPSLGGITVKRDSLAAMASALEAGAAWLDQPGRSVLIFPQGRFRPHEVRPLGLQRGVRLLQRMSDAPIVPVSVSTRFVDHHLPALLLTFGEPIEPGRRDLMEVLESRLVEGLDAHVSWLDDPSRPARFEVVVRSGVRPIEHSFWTRLWGWVSARFGRRGGQRTS